MVGEEGAGREERMDVDLLVDEVLDGAFEVHRTLGPGLLESVYEMALMQELRSRGLKVRRQIPIPISYKGEKLDIGFRIDLLVEDCLLVELKSVEQIHIVHRRQVLTYLRVLDYRIGLLLNFGAAWMKDGIVRIINGY